MSEVPGFMTVGWDSSLIIVVNNPLETVLWSYHRFVVRILYKGKAVLFLILAVM